jgi:phosphate/sulfate permease
MAKALPFELETARGAGAARGLKTLNRKALTEIVFSWFFTPMLAGIVSFGLYHLLFFILKVQ